MVDVGAKTVSSRTATAEATVLLGRQILDELRRGEFTTKKGSVTQTAIIAGTMAVKQTWSVIPLCHPLPIHGCTISVQEADEASLHISCTVSTEGKTGVEMEALHGASVAALTVYDMCKAMSPYIEITNLRLLSKRGGKSDYDRE
jgi:cyclic pyranopterin phosphate synthase